MRGGGGGGGGGGEKIGYISNADRANTKGEVKSWAALCLCS